MSEPWIDVDDHPATEVGIYAVVKCWDANEGQFTGVESWDGLKWSSSAVVLRSPMTFPTEAEAEAWGDQYDR